MNISATCKMCCSNSFDITTAFPYKLLKFTSYNQEQSLKFSTCFNGIVRPLPTFASPFFNFLSSLSFF